MARSAPAFRLGKPVYTLLAVIFGQKVESNGGASSSHGATESASLILNESGRGTAAFLQPGKEKSVNGKGIHGLPGYPDLVSGGQLEVQLLENPSKDELKSKLQSVHPKFVSFHGEQGSGTGDVGSARTCTPDELVALFGTKLPDLVYLENPSGDKLGKALQAVGIKHVIYWNRAVVTHCMAHHFRQGLVAALQSSAAGGWDAYHVAKACFQISCSQPRLDRRRQVTRNGCPVLLGDAPPNIELPTTKVSSEGDGLKAQNSAMSAIQTFGDDVEVRLLVCTEINKLDPAWLNAMEAGLSGLLTIEARAVRLLNRHSHRLPMAAALSSGELVTMRCDICTASHARVPLLVSGSAQLCLDDQQLESCIKKELVEKNRLVQVLRTHGDRKELLPPIEGRRSVSIACGARVLELRILTTAWAAQVLRQLSAEPSYRSLAALGIAGVQGVAVGAFRKEDAIRLASSKVDCAIETDYQRLIPDWFIPAVPSRKRVKLISLSSHSSNDSFSEKIKTPEKPIIGKRVAAVVGIGWKSRLLLG